MRSSLWQGKPWQAFKNFAIIFSFIVNFVLIIVLLLITPLIIPIVSEIANPIVGGLNQSFEEMGAANIEQTITVSDTMPIAFTLPLEETTNVVLAQDVPLNEPATVSFPGNQSVIFGQVQLTLREGTVLPVDLKLNVPVSQTIPVQLAVPVDIPLDETELGTPFGRLQSLFSPLAHLLDSLPKTNAELGERVLSGPPAPEAEPESQASTRRR